MIFPLVLNFAETLVSKDLNILKKEVVSLQACGRLLDTMLMVKRNNPANITPSFYKKQWEDYMELHQQAYKKAFITPKHHWAGHHPQQWERDGFPFDCWTGERMHKLPKGIAQSIKALSSFEASVVARQVIHQVKQLQAMSLQSGLLRPVTPSEVLQTALGVQHCLVARSLQYLGATYSANDVLCFGNGMFGEVKACCEADDAHVLLVKKMECIEKVSNSSSLCSVGSLAAVNLKDYPIYTAYDWTTVERGILVLHTSLM